MEGRGQVARWGGEEFLLTFENTELDRAYKLLDQIRARIAEQEFTFKDVSLHLTITGGIEEYSMTESIDAIITRADENYTEVKPPVEIRLLLSAFFRIW